MAGEIVRELFTRLGFITDDKGAKRFEKQNERLTKSMESTANRITGLAAGIGASLAAAFGVQAARDFIAAQQEQVKQIQTYSLAINTSTEDTQRYAFAAREAGVDFDDFTQGVIDLTERLADATLNGGEMAEQFGRLKVQGTDSNGKLKDGVSVYLEVADKLKNMEDRAQATLIGQSLLGDTYGRTAKLIDQGSESFLRNAAAADAAGAVISEKQIKTLAELAKVQRRVTDAASALARRLLERVMPALIRGSEALAAFLGDGEKVDKLLGQLKIAFGAIGAAFAAKQLLGLGQALSLLPGLLVAAGKAAFGASRGFAILQASVVALPLAGAAFLLFLQDAATFLQGGDSLIGRFIARFEDAEGPMGAVARTLQAIAPQAAALFGEISKLAEDAMPSIIAALTSFGQIAAQVFQRIVTDVIPPMIMVVGWIIDAIRKIAPAFSVFVGKVLAMAGSLVKTAGPIVFGLVAGAIALIETLLPPVLKVAGFIIDAITMVSDGIGAAISALSPTFETLFGWIKSATDALAPLIDLVGQAASAVGAVTGLGSTGSRSGVLSSISASTDLAPRAAQAITNSRQGGATTINNSVKVDATGMSPEQAVATGTGIVSGATRDAERRATARGLV